MFFNYSAWFCFPAAALCLACGAPVPLWATSWALSWPPVYSSMDMRYARTYVTHAVCTFVSVAQCDATRCCVQYAFLVTSVVQFAGGIVVFFGLLTSPKEVGKYVKEGLYEILFSYVLVCHPSTLALPCSLSRCKCACVY